RVSWDRDPRRVLWPAKPVRRMFSLAPAPRSPYGRSMVMRTQVLVVGGGVGGVAAALAAADAGLRVTLTEPTDWLGGVLTSQAVPPDEHVWIEQFGCTRSYRRLRDEIRHHYRRWYPLT